MDPKWTQMDQNGPKMACVLQIGAGGSDGICFVQFDQYFVGNYMIL